MSASPDTQAGLLTKVDAGWIHGMNTIRHPWILRPDQYRIGTNVVNRGGVVQTRPGRKMRLILPPGNLQELKEFRKTRDSNLLDNVDVNTAESEVDYLVAIVDGKVYAIPFPLAQPKDWEKLRLKGLNFDPKVPQVIACVAQKSVTINADGFLSLTPTYNILMIQDGINDAGYWDGIEHGHVKETAPTLGTPKGTWMAYVGDRLWVARGKIVLYSDLLDPLSFRERTEGIGRGDFNFPNPITGLAPFIGENRQEILVVMTIERSEILNVGIRDRSLWATTPNFQSVLFPSTGCVAGRSIVFQSGLMWWYSQGGLVSSDTATTTYLTSQVNYRDAEMAFSKQYFAEDLSQICGASFENYLLMSVPVSQRLNSETFVLDFSVVSELTSQEKTPAWNSSWTGTRPVAWATASINGKKRIFSASVDYTSVANSSFNSVWEEFVSDRVDTFFTLDPDFQITEYEQSIFCEMETRQLGDELTLKKFKYAKIFAIQLSGDVQVRVDYRGKRGSYKNILCTKFIAPTTYADLGIKNGEEERSEWGMLRHQSRDFKTEEVVDNPNCPTCESEHGENIDKCFSLLIRWCGKMAIEAIEVNMLPFPETATGKCEPAETKVCIVDENGLNHVRDRVPGYISPEDLYQTQELPVFVSRQSYTSTLSCGLGAITDPVSVTAIATYRSSVSQDDADQQALTAATNAAINQAAYYRSIYPCLWEGIEYVTRTCLAALNDSVTSIGVQSSGQIIVAGLFDHDITSFQGRIAARRSDGTRLPSWSVGYGFDNSVRQVYVDSADRVYVVGQFTFYDSSETRGIVRLLSGGSIDSSFIAGTGLSTYRVGLSVSAQSGGKLIVGGFMSEYDGTPLDSGIVRLNTDGSLDGTFTPETGYSRVYAQLILSDDSIILAGWNGTTVSDPGTIIKLNADGTLDGTFTGFSWDVVDKVSMAVDADGKILVAADGINSTGLVRLETNGSVDASLVLGTGFNGAVNCVKVLADGTLLVAGDFTTLNGVAVPRVVKLSSIGVVDVSFGAGAGPNASVNDLLVRENGTILIGGAFTQVDGEPSYSFAILDENGNFIPSFETTIQQGIARSPDGQVSADDLAEAQAEAKAIAQLPCN